MNIRILSTLAVLAILASLAAVWAVHREVADWRTPAHGKKVFPQLASRVNEASKIVVRHAGGTLTIERGDSSWRIVESDGYPAQGKTVGRVLGALSELRWLEPKTRKADRYPKLQLEDADTEGAKSRRLTVLNGKGETLADLIVGKENLYLQAISDGGAYIRMPGEKQAWLAGGQLAVGEKPKDWIVSTLFDFPRARISRAVIRHPNGDVITVRKTGKDEPPFEVVGIPAGKKLADPLYPTDIGRALEKFEIHDARKVENVPFPAAETVTARFETTENLVIRLQVTTIDKQRWVRLDTSETVTPNAQIQTLAKAIAAGTNGWAFHVPEFEAVHITKPWTRILEDAGGKS